MTTDEKLALATEALTLMDFNYQPRKPAPFYPDADESDEWYHEAYSEAFIPHVRSMALAWLATDPRAFDRLWQLQVHFDIDIPNFPRTDEGEAALNAWAEQQTALFTYDAWRAWVDSWMEA